MKELTLFNNSSIVNLIGISGLKHLQYLRLGNYKKLNSLEGLEGLKNIEYLEINTCKKLKSFSEISGLESLKRLHLDNNGDIYSLNPLKENSKLEIISFVESTNILDGDMKFLLELKNLSLAYFMNRKHYSHKTEEVWPEEFRNLQRELRAHHAQT